MTDKAAGKKGISAFIVDTKTPGYVVARIEEKLGQRASDTAQIVFENCAVPAANLLGREGDGYRIALANLEGGRIGIAAQAVGMARAAFEAALAYARERQAFGKPIAEHQAVKFRLADMATQDRRRAADGAGTRPRCATPASRASRKRRWRSCSRRRWRSACASDAMQMHGGYGYVTDFPVERIYRDVRVCQIYEGTSDIQRMVIGTGAMAGDEAQPSAEGATPRGIARPTPGAGSALRGRG